MAPTSNASNWQQREEEAVKKLRESLPQWTGSLDDDAPLPRGTKTQTGVLPDPPPLEPREKELQKLLDDESLPTFEEKGQAALVELRKAEAEWLMRSDIFFRLTVLSRSQ